MMPRRWCMWINAYKRVGLLRNCWHFELNVTKPNVIKGIKVMISIKLVEGFCVISVISSCCSVYSIFCLQGKKIKCLLLGLFKTVLIFVLTLFLSHESTEETLIKVCLTWLQGEAHDNIQANDTELHRLEVVAEKRKSWNFSCSLIRQYNCQLGLQAHGFNISTQPQTISSIPGSAISNSAPSSDSRALSFPAGTISTSSVSQLHCSCASISCQNLILTLCWFFSSLTAGGLASTTSALTCGQTLKSP